MDLFSEVQATLNADVLEQAGSFHQILEEVEARTNVDIRFTKRSYVFCGTWSQLQLVREILGQHYSGKFPKVSTTNSSDRVPSRSSFSTNSETSGVHSLEDVHQSNRGDQTSFNLNPYPATPQRELAYTAAGSAQSNDRMHVMSLDQTGCPKGPVLKQVYVEEEPATPHDKEIPGEVPPVEPTLSGNELTVFGNEYGDGNFPEMMVDTDMWEYMAKKNAFEIRNLKKDFHITLNVSSDGDLTRLLIEPEKDHKTSTDSLETVHGVLGNLYQNMFTSVVVEACEVPANFDNQETCKSALDEVTVMFCNVLTKQSEYEPRLFRFIGEENEAKKARYTFMELIGMRKYNPSIRYHRSGQSGGGQPRSYSFEEESDGAAGYTPGHEEYFASAQTHIEQTPEHQYEGDLSSSSSSASCEPQFQAQKVTPERATGRGRSSSKYEVGPNVQQKFDNESRPALQKTEVSDDEYSSNEDMSNKVSISSFDAEDPSLPQKPNTNINHPLDLNRTDTDQDHASNDAMFTADLINFDSDAQGISSQTSFISERQMINAKVEYNATGIDGVEKKTDEDNAKAIDRVEKKTDDTFLENISAKKWNAEPEVESSNSSYSPPQIGNDKSEVPDDTYKSCEVLSYPLSKSQPNELHQMLQCKSYDKVTPREHTNEYSLDFLNMDETPPPRVDTDDKSTNAEDGGGTNKTNKAERRTDSSVSRYGKSGGVMPAHNPFESKPGEPMTTSIDNRNKLGQNPLKMTQPENHGEDSTQNKTATTGAKCSSGEVTVKESRFCWSARLQRIAGRICESCMEAMSKPREMPCSHVFCQSCADACLQADHVCPRCGLDWWMTVGEQPEGEFNIVIDKKMSLSGFQKVGTICINIFFPAGRQHDDRPYRDTKWTAYLPNNADGRYLLKQLKKVFDRKLLCATTSHENELVDLIEIVGVTLKTEANGRNGYPDRHYLDTLKDDLKYRGASYDV